MHVSVCMVTFFNSLDCFYYANFLIYATICMRVSKSGHFSKALADLIMQISKFMPIYACECEVSLIDFLH